MFFAMFFASPFVFLLALATAGFARLRGPHGISYLVWLGLIGTGVMALLAFLLTIHLLVGEGARMQRQFLGREYAGFHELRAFRISEFPDPMEQFVYRPSSEALTALKARCRPPRVGDVHDCSLYHHGDDSDFDYGYVEGDALILGFMTT